MTDKLNLITNRFREFYAQAAILGDAYAAELKVPTVAAYILVGLDVDSEYLRKASGLGSWRLAQPKAMLQAAGIISVNHQPHGRVTYHPTELLTWAASAEAAKWVAASEVPDFVVLRSEIEVANLALQRLAEADSAIGNS